jgi:hypothetical protein
MESSNTSLQIATIGHGVIACSVLNGIGYFAKAERVASATLVPRQVDVIDHLSEHNCSWWPPIFNNNSIAPALPVTLARLKTGARDVRDIQATFTKVIKAGLQRQLILQLSKK